MKKLRIISICILILSGFIQNAAAQWQTDYTYGFKINIPSNWTKNAYMDGTDQVYDYYSADQNAAIQLRALRADPRINLDMLIQVYEQNMLPAFTQKISLENHTSFNGIPGKQGIYSTNYNGNTVTMATFYTIQNGNAYVLTAIIPNEFLSQKQEEVKAITRSFIINGFEPQTASNEKRIKPALAPSGARPTTPHQPRTQTPKQTKKTPPANNSKPSHTGYVATWPNLGSWQHIAAMCDTQVTSESLHPTTGYKREHHRIAGPWELRFDYPENWSRKSDSYGIFFTSDKGYGNILVTDVTKWTPNPEKTVKADAEKAKDTQYLGEKTVKGITMYLTQSKQIVGMQNNKVLRHDFVTFKTPKNKVYTIRFTSYYNQFDQNVRDVGLHLLNCIAFYDLSR